MGRGEAPGAPSQGSGVLRAPAPKFCQATPSNAAGDGGPAWERAEASQPHSVAHPFSSAARGECQTCREPACTVPACRPPGRGPLECAGASLTLDPPSPPLHLAYKLEPLLHRCPLAQMHAGVLHARWSRFCETEGGTPMVWNPGLPSAAVPVRSPLLFATGPPSPPFRLPCPSPPPPAPPHGLHPHGCQGFNVSSAGLSPFPLEAAGCIAP